MIKKETIKRTIHYYEFEIKFQEDFIAEDGNQFREFFSQIAKLGETKDAMRYQQVGERKIFIQGVRFSIDGSKTIEGMLRCVRADLLPEIMNTIDDSTKGLEILENEGIVETTHFIIDYANEVKKIAIEYNLYGAKVTDILYYWDMIGSKCGFTKEGISYRPVTKNELAKLKDRIGKCAELYVCVHKNDVEKVKNIDKNCYSALQITKDSYTPEYAILSLKFDYKQREETKEANLTIKNFINSFTKKPETLKYFNVLKAKTEDKDNNFKLEIFDLLIDKVQSKIVVEKVPKYRTIVSKHMFEVMKIEMKKKKI
jgi:hypothetical protein